MDQVRTIYLSQQSLTQNIYTFTPTSFFSVEANSSSHAKLKIFKT